MRPGSPTLKEIPWSIVGSNHFGRVPKISDEQTFNMVRADDFMVDYSGYKKNSDLSLTYKGRAIYTSINANLLFAVIGNAIYSINSNLFSQVIGFLNTFNGDVFITENDTNQIVFCDKKSLYVFNYANDTFIIPTLPQGMLPGYVTFQDGYIIVVDLLSNRWYLSAPGDATNYFWGSSGQSVFETLSTKSDLCKAAIRFPGRGNLLLVLGGAVGEYFTDVGSPPLAPYKRNPNININFGTLNQATIAAEDSIVMWLGSNENSGAVIMISEGGSVKEIDNDGINYRLSLLKHPEQSSAFFIRIGNAQRLYYQITFYHPDDNSSYLYHIATNEFFTVTDENWNYHITRKVAFFNNAYYFVSFNDGALYQMSTQTYVYDYGLFQDSTPKIYPIPRARICKNVRDDNGDAFVINSGSFIIEQGEDLFYPELSHPDYYPHIDLSISIDGGQNFSSFYPLNYKFTGNRINRPLVWGLGYANDFVSQFRFWSYARLAVGNGVLNVYK